VAFGTTTHFSKNVEWDQIVEPGFVSIVFRNTDGILSLFPQTQSGGGSATEWRVNTAGNTSTEVFSEGGAQPTPVAQTYVMATLSYIYFRAMARITGHLRDAIRGQAIPDQFNVIANEFSLAGLDIRDLMETTFQGSSNNGIQLAIDSAGTYANINRSTVSAWGSYENALSGALTWAEIMNAREALRDNERGSKVDLIILPWNQLTNLQTLATAPGSANSAFRMSLDGPPTSINMAPRDQGTMFGDARVVAVGDLLDTILLYLNSSDWDIVVHRQFEVRPDTSGDDDVWQLSTAATLRCKQTRRQGKSTGVTA